MIVFEMTAQSKDELIEKLEAYQQQNQTDNYGTTIRVPLKDGEMWIAQIVKSACV
tara:strand:- start:1115 stop:1279 length:165 start_codon:yes stop_codon:yes gene_type:complete